MKYVKILGLLAVAAAAMMAFAVSASATTITSPTGTAGTPTIEAEPEGGHVKLENAIAKIECGSEVVGTVGSHGNGVTAAGNITTLNWPGCTNSWHVTTSEAGSLEVHWIAPQKEGEVSYNGVLTSNGALVKSTRFLVPCNYETKNTKIGTVTGGNPATLHIEASIPIAAGSSELCGSGNAKWEGNYVSKSAIYVDE